MEFHLAQVNIAKMLAPLESPLMAEFVANLEKINSLADHADGFVWRLKEEGSDATSINIFGDDRLLVNMSVWRNMDALARFVYQPGHVEVMKRRREWFERIAEMHMACWYVPEGHLPTVPEAEERLLYFRTHGETPFSFGFRKRFTFEEAAQYTPIPRQGDGNF